MICSTSFERINKVIQLSINENDDPLTKALQIARESGAFRHNNVVFVHNQLYKINPRNPAQSLKEIVYKAS